MQYHKIETISELICEDGSIRSTLIFIKIIGSDTLRFPLPPPDVLLSVVQFKPTYVATLANLLSVHFLIYHFNQKYATDRIYFSFNNP